MILVTIGRLRGDEFASGTWVVISEIDDGHWGEGGVVLYKDEVPNAANASGQANYD